MSQPWTERGPDLNPSSDLLSLVKSFVSGPVSLNSDSQSLGCNVAVRSVSYLEADLGSNLSSPPELVLRLWVLLVMDPWFPYL